MEAQQQYQHLSDQDLLKRVYYTDMKNRQLQGRISQLEPYKQREIKNPPIQKHQQLFEKFEMQKYALKIMYVGINYNGMEYQQNKDNTIEGFIFKCLFGLSLIKQKVPDIKQYTRAARTDSGVSAYGNVIALNLRSNVLKVQQSKEQIIQQKQSKQGLNYVKMINSILPEDIRVISSCKVDKQFSARYSCTRRSYKYFFPKGYYNIEFMKQAIKKFQGKHSFINFCKLDITSTIDFEKTIFKASIEKCNQKLFGLNKDQRNEVYYFHFVANSFLWHQIRYMTTILFLVGMGRHKPEIVDELLDTVKTPNKPNYPTAPEFPLILEDCVFDNIQFKITKEQGVNMINTLNTVIMTRVMEMTLYVNCLAVMEGWAKNSIGLQQQSLIKQAIIYGQKRQANRRSKIQYKAATGITYQQKKSILNEKQKQLHDKKIQKRKNYQNRLNVKANIKQN